MRACALRPHDLDMLRQAMQHDIVAQPVQHDAAAHADAFEAAVCAAVSRSIRAAEAARARAGPTRVVITTEAELRDAAEEAARATRRRGRQCAAPARSPTPDVLLDQPVEVRCAGRVYSVRWLDAKNYYGAGCLRARVARQLQKYIECWGSGALVMSQGFCTSFQSGLERGGGVVVLGPPAAVTPTDARPTCATAAAVSSSGTDRSGSGSGSDTVSPPHPPALRCGQTLRVSWPHSDGGSRWLTARIIDVRRSRRFRRGSNLKYGLCFERQLASSSSTCTSTQDDLCRFEDTIYWTRLAHLPFEVIVTT